MIKTYRVSFDFKTSRTPEEHFKHIEDKAELEFQICAVKLVPGSYKVEELPQTYEPGEIVSHATLDGYLYEIVSGPHLIYTGTHDDDAYLVKIKGTALGISAKGSHGSHILISSRLISPAEF